MKLLSKNSFTPIVITPPSKLEFPNFRELWEYKGLFFFLVRRDLKVRFQQTFIGFLWIVLQPMIQMTVFYVILGIIVKVPTGNIPYHLFFLSGFVVWQFFNQIVNSSAISLIGNISIIVKSYFPRLALPLSSVIGALVDFCISFVILIVFLLIDGNYPISPRYLIIPILLMLTMIFASGVGLLFGALMVVFRDTKNFFGFILMIWMYLTPIMFPLKLAPEEFKVFFYFNPLTSLIDGFRWAVLMDGTLPSPAYLSVSLVVAIIIWLCGAIVFRAMENVIADVM